MEALLIKHDMWAYVNGAKTKPEIVATDPESRGAAEKWETEDSKAKTDIILSINPSELKQVKGCTTSRQVWLKLQEIYQSKGPARKATLLKRLTLHKMTEGEDVREHLTKFFDTVDKLDEMEVQINQDLLAIRLLYSLPHSFENFRCDIESRDELPSPEILRIKIVEESDARKGGAREDIPNAMFAKKKFDRRGEKVENKTKFETFKFKCHRCRKIGHKAADCKEKLKQDDKANCAESNASLYVVEDATACAVKNLAKSSVARNATWCIDSGCTAHLCNSENKFTNIANNKLGTLSLASNDTTEIKARGTAFFVAEKDGKLTNVTVNDTLYEPDLRTNLLSVAKITDKGLRVIFDNKSAKIIGNDNEVILSCERKDGLYVLREKEQNIGACLTEEYKTDTDDNSIQVWHRRMGHLNIKDLLECNRNGRVRGMCLKYHDSNYECDTCLHGKMSKIPFPKLSERNSSLLEIIHSDVCGPMRVESNGKAKYFVTFIDNYSGWCEIRLLKGKHQVFEPFKEFKIFVKNQTGNKIKYLQSHNGKEYCNKEFDDFLKSRGIGRRLTVTHNPEQNGVAERRNRTLMDMTRCLLIQSRLPNSFWGEAVNTANYIRNRCPSKTLNGETPYKKWTGRTPNVSYFKEFGCEIHTLNRDPTKGKLDPRSKKGIFIGYAEKSKAYRIWIPEERRVDIARDMKFMNVCHPRQKILQIYSTSRRVNLLIQKWNFSQIRACNETKTIYGTKKTKITDLFMMKRMKLIKNQP